MDEWSMLRISYRRGNMPLDCRVRLVACSGMYPVVETVPIENYEGKFLEWRPQNSYGETSLFYENK